MTGNPSVPNKPAHPLNILLVDDIPENLELIQDLLQERGYRVTATKSPLDALAIAERDEIHMIIADALMPKMDGLELCKKIKQQPSRSTIPFIIYTGNYVDREDEDLARSIGVDRYVMKFAGTAALIDAVHELSRARYGFQGEPVHPQPEATLDDQAFLERHHSLVTKKLEEKMNELRVYADTLEQKNRDLASSEKRYRSLFENASVAIFIVDARRRRIIDLNRQAEVLLGCTVLEALAFTDLPFEAPDGTRVNVLAFDTAATQECLLRSRKGDLLDVDVTAGPVDLPGDARVMLFVRDITESKRMRNQLMQAEKMTIMGRLAAGIAHEIRNPLAGVNLNLHYLGLKIPAESPEHTSIDAALEGTQRIQQVIEDTLSLARVIPPTLKAESVNDVISRALNLITVPLRQKEMSVETTYADPLPPVMMDAKQIQQVLLNVFQNAIDASPEKSVIAATTELGMVEGVPSVIVRVRDRGPGVSPELARHVFDGFHTTKQGGTGLGLMLSKFIIERHRGAISLENAPEGGTVVRLVFPTLDAEGKETSS